VLYSNANTCGGVGDDEVVEKLRRAQRKYRDIVDKQTNVELEHYFPAHHKWMLRVCVDQGTYIGYDWLCSLQFPFLVNAQGLRSRVMAHRRAKDIGIDHVSGKFSVVAKDGRILVTLRDVKAVVQVYGFRLAGGFECSSGSLAIGYCSGPKCVH